MRKATDSRDAHYWAEHWPRLVDDETVRRANLWARLERDKSAQKDELDRCREDHHYWLGNWAWLLDPKNKNKEHRRLPLIAWPEQTRLINFLEEGIELERDRMVNKARSIGASWLALGLITHHWLFEEYFMAKVGSRKDEFASGDSPDSLMGKIRELLKTLPHWMVPERARSDESLSKLQNPTNGSEILGESTNENFGRGGRRKVVLVDEAAHILPRLQNSVALALESVASSVWYLSTPNGTGNRFHTDWISKPEADKLQIGWRADPRRTDEWFEGLLRENGGRLTFDEREQEYNCSFAAVSGIRIWRIPESPCEQPHTALPRESEFARPYASMDFGSGPSHTVWGLLLAEYDREDETLIRIWVDRVHYWSRTPAQVIAGDINGSSMSLYKRHVTTYGDPAGIAAESDQESWSTRLGDHGAPVVCLDAHFNSREFINAGLDDVQDAIDRDFIRFNKDDPGVIQLLVDLRAWEWNVPPGIELVAINKAEIQPKKDGRSHGGDMLRYGFQAIRDFHGTLQRKTMPDERQDEAAQTLGHRYGKMMDAL